MLDLSELGASLRIELERRHAARESALAASRRAIRSSSNAIRAQHRDEGARAQDLLREARAELAEGLEAASGHPSVEQAGFLTDAAKEVAEAATFLAIASGGDVPGPTALGVDAAAYANGLAETVGELRRHLLDGLRAGALDRSEALLAAMEEILAVLVTIDLPDGITGGLRRSTDVARSITERTRGDLTTALVQARLQAALEQHRRDVLGG